MARLPKAALRENGDVMMTTYWPIHIGLVEIAVGLANLLDADFETITRKEAFDEAVKYIVHFGELHSFNWQDEVKSEEECMAKAKKLFPELKMKED